MPRWGYGFWRGELRKYEGPVIGDTSRLVAEETNAFIKEAARGKLPFLAVAWFFAPHAPLAAGDYVLRQIATRLLESNRRTCFIARFAGPGFGVILHGAAPDVTGGTVPSPS